jgi:antitoxin FitA
MAQLIVRNLEDDIKERLRRRAKARGRSMEEEARDILRTALLAEKKEKKGLGTIIAERFSGAGIGLEENIPEWKGFPVRAPKFDK